MPSSGTLRHVALVRTDVSEERVASMNRMTRIGELETLEVTSNGSIIFLRRVLRLLVTANLVPNSPIISTLMIEAMRSSETPVLARATWYNIPDDGILYFICNDNILF
jgi:hypothetical protein